MKTPRILLTFYSRSGNTERVAFEIARDLGKLGIDCDVEPLEECMRRRRGVLGWLRTALAAVLARPADLQPIRRDPADYDLAVLGTPIWAGGVSTPMRAFLLAHRKALRHVAFFLTYGGAARARAIRQLTRLSRQAPVAELAVRARDLAPGAHHAGVKAFVVAIAGALGVVPRRVATPCVPSREHNQVLA